MKNNLFKPALLSMAALVACFATARAADRPSVPPEAELKKMATAAVLDFNEGIRTKDFTKFHATASTPFRQQVPPDKMRKAFNEFIEKKVDLSRVKGVEPTFDREPALVQEGRVLELVGHYETPPVNPHFSLKFYREAGEWKLLGINVDLRAAADPKAERPSPPAEAEAKKLVRQTLLDFNDAVQLKDFSAFHARASSPLRQQITPEKLREAFQSFIDRKVNIAAVKDLEPKLAGPPKVDGEGVLTVKGEYPTRPTRTAFQLKYFLEKGEWRVLGVSVDTTETEQKEPEKGKE
jgi:Ca2+-binding EF-hand superfamily protein